MTHEELLAVCDNYLFKDSTEPVKALRAVVELHKPIWDNQPMSKCQCRADMAYPCPTIQAIEKELGNA